MVCTRSSRPILAPGDSNRYPYATTFPSADHLSDQEVELSNLVLRDDGEEGVWNSQVSERDGAATLATAKHLLDVLDQHGDDQIAGLAQEPDQKIVIGQGTGLDRAETGHAADVGRRNSLRESRNAGQKGRQPNAGRRIGDELAVGVAEHE